MRALGSGHWCGCEPAPLGYVRGTVAEMSELVLSVASAQ